MTIEATHEQIISSSEYHFVRAGKSCEVWRRNGATKLWKTRPNEFRIPVKHGLYDHGYITQSDIIHVDHIGTDCNIDRKGKVKV